MTPANHDNTNKKPGLLLSGDKPVSDPVSDRLGYATFARQLAKSIASMAPSEGIVMALYGPWGSGKSTMLNFVEHYLAQEAANIVIVHFNPWWFSGHTDLAQDFFRQLELALKRKKTWEKLRKGISSLASTVAKAKDVVPFGGAGEAVASVVKPPTKDVPQLKTEIGTFLVENKVRLLVVIDDIDRLTAEEVRQVFRVIKAVADFPNVVYFLAFDKAVAIQALEQAQAVPGSGEAYLEKIVQVPFELPLPDRPALRLLFMEELNVILADTPDKLFSESYWTNMYFAGIDHFMQTPRDVVRLLNVLRVTYPAVCGEVNPVDFIALETLRVFCPAVYNALRNAPEMFAGNTESSRHNNRQNEFKAFYEALMQKVDEADRDTVRELLSHIFPKAQYVWQGMGYGADWEGRWRRELRACSVEVLPVYFRLTVPEGTLSNQEMEKFVALGGDTVAFAEKLIAFSAEPRRQTISMSRARSALVRLQDFTEEHIPKEHVAPMVTALFEIADRLIEAEPETRGMFDFGIDIDVGRISWQLLRRLEEPERFSLLQQIFPHGKALGMIVREVAVLGQQHGKYGSENDTPEDRRLISAEHLDALEQIALQRIRKAAATGELLATNQCLALLYRWRDWAGDEEEPRTWLTEVIKRDEALLNLLEKTVYRTKSQNMGEVAVRVRSAISIEAIEPFIELTYLTNRADLLSKQELTGSQREVVDLLIKELSQYKQGHSPLEDN